MTQSATTLPKHGDLRLNSLVRNLATIALLALATSGCVVAMRIGSQPTEVKLRVQGKELDHCSVRVATESPKSYPLAPDGRVEFTVPTLYGGCDAYLFGFIKTRDGSPEKIPVVELLRGDRIKRKLSLNQIAKLPRDDAGCSVVALRD